ncbi:MAG: putative metalloprotease CJM1_0395 family protein [Candidatus Hydrogenedentota bacterium]
MAALTGAIPPVDMGNVQRVDAVSAVVPAQRERGVPPTGGRETAPEASARKGALVPVRNAFPEKPLAPSQGPRAESMPGAGIASRTEPGTVLPPSGFSPAASRAPLSRSGLAPQRDDASREAPSNGTAREVQADAAREAEPGIRTPGELTPEEQRAVTELKQRDREVRQHEQAHVAAGGQYVRGGADFKYTTGPDNRRYATGGEVNIDVSTERTPEATIRKMQVVRRAAMAPRQPSPQDRRVAAQASQNEARARQELAEARREEESGAARQADRARPEDIGKAEGTLQPAGAGIDDAGGLLPGARQTRESIGSVSNQQPERRPEPSSFTGVPGGGAFTPGNVIREVIGGGFVGGVQALDYRV